MTNRRERRFDLVLAAGIVALTQRDVWAQAGDPVATKAAIAAALLVATASLAWRRRAALMCAALIGAAVAFQAILSDVDYSSAGTAIAILVGLYSVGAYAELPAAAFGCAALVAGLATRELNDLESYRQDPSNAAFWWLLVGTSFGTGVYVRSRRHGERLRRLAGEFEVESAERERAAVAEERTRIARELHDVVAHDVSAVVVQAEAAEELLEREPERARESLSTIQRLGREALTEMRHAVSAMRAGDEAGTRAPQPSLADLPQLVDRNRAAGLETAYVVEGEPRPLPPGLEVSAYRIVQEALTNTRKHAGDARARVALRYGGGTFEVDVSDDGAGGRAPAPGSGSGSGLIGMRERVQFFGGTFHAGARPDGGFVVHASFPVPVPAGA